MRSVCLGAVFCLWICFVSEKKKEISRFWLTKKIRETRHWKTRVKPVSKHMISSHCY